MKAEKSPLVNKFECESHAEIVHEKTYPSSVPKVFGALFTVVLMSCAFFAGRHSVSMSIKANSEMDETPVVAIPLSGGNIEVHPASVTQPLCTNPPGAADFTSWLNKYRRSPLPQLQFYLASQKDPLAVTAIEVGKAWCTKSPVTKSGFYNPVKSSTATILAASFKTANVSPPTKYVEYDYYGENCATKMFTIVKYGPTNAKKDMTIPGANVMNDLLSKDYNHVGVSLSQLPGDIKLNNAYWVMIFTTDYTWAPKKKGT